MGTFADFPLLTIFVLAMLVLAMIRIFSPKKPPFRMPQRQSGDGAAMDPAHRMCRACGTENPQLARYCRRCGKGL